MTIVKIFKGTLNVVKGSIEHRIQGNYKLIFNLDSLELVSVLFQSDFVEEYPIRLFYDQEDCKAFEFGPENQEITDWLISQGWGKIKVDVTLDIEFEDKGRVAFLSGSTKFTHPIYGSCEIHVTDYDDDNGEVLGWIITDYCGEELDDETQKLIEADLMLEFHGEEWVDEEAEHNKLVQDYLNSR